MNNKWLIILMAVTLALVCALLGMNIAGNTSAGGISAGTVSVPDVVSVYGQGKVSVKPDVAYLTMGYENTDKDPKAAQDENSEKMEQIISALRDGGIEEDNIRTTQYDVNQEYDYTGSQRTVTGYRVTNTVSVKIEDVDTVGDVINLAINAGANVFYGISFDVADRQQVYLEAMDIALGRAEEKAKAYAEKEGRKISKAIEINEGAASTSGTYTSQLSNYLALSYARDASVPAADSSSIATGQVEITATVTVVYGMD